MTENVGQTECPGFDDISAYMDGEAESSVQEHIASCKQCQHILASLQILDSAVDRACQVPVGLNERILAACKEAGDEGSVPAIVPFWGRSVVRYAAAIALTLGLAMAVRNTVGNSHNQSQTGEESLAVATADAQAGEAMTPERRAVVIGSAEVSPVGVTGSQTQPVAAPTASQRVMASAVTHVWGMKDLGKVRSEFFSLLPQDAIRSVAQSESDSAAFQVKLTDAQLQKLVEAMHAKGWALFSPELPQPGEEARVKLTGADVVYQARFVSTAAN